MNEEEVMQRHEAPAPLGVAGKKRLPMTPHPAKTNENAKRRSPTNPGPAKGIKSTNNVTTINDSETNHHFELSSSGCEGKNNIMNEDQNVVRPSITENDHDLQKERKNDDIEVDDDSNIIISTTIDGEEGRDDDNDNDDDNDDDKDDDNEGKEDTGVEESDENDSGDDHNKRWKFFIDSINVEETPNLDSYIEAKNSRGEKVEQFANAIGSIVQSMRDTANEIVSDVIEPVCNEYTERFENAEQNIIKTMVSNHSRRQNLSKLMVDADMAWSNQYTKLMTDIWNEEVIQDNDDQLDEKGENKVKGMGGKELTPSKVQVKSNSNNKNSLTVISSDNITKGTTQTDDEINRSNNNNSIYGYEDSDLSELLEYEPTREKILPFYNERDKRYETMKAFETVIDDVHAGMQNEIESIVQITSNLYTQHKNTCEDMEYDIESYIMENYERRRDLQQELENSAQKAQALFGNLLAMLDSKVK